MNYLYNMRRLFYLPVLLLFVLFTSCQTEKNVSFSEEYITAHKGQFEVYVPEVHELANILVAISKVGRMDSNMVDMTTDYYKKVLEKFLPYANEPIMDTINKHITAPYDMNGYWYYYAMKMNACAYVYTDNNSILHTGPVNRMGFDNMPDPILRNLALIEDFSRKSGFREFYRQNQDYYTSLIQLYRQLNPIDKMQQWLEAKFGFGYGNYAVYFSPLVGGAHATQRYADRHFEQTAMFVCRSELFPDYNLPVNEMLQSRVVFTEIDHNFVNPVSDKNRKAIDKAFAERAKWVEDSDNSGTAAYNNAYGVFNEYMTFAVFSLYCIDHFEQKDIDIFMPKMEHQMSELRHFIKFREFNQQLIKIYLSNRSATPQELYDQVLDWAEMQ